MGRYSRIALLLTFACFITHPLQAIEMKAGVAKGVITNDEPLVMVNGNVSEGTLKDIHARVLTLNDSENRLVLVTYDLNCLDHATPILRQRCRDELGMDPSHLLLLATHNHSAPIQINPKNFDYGKHLAEVIFGLIQEAIAAETGPVVVLLGSGEGYFVRALGNAPADYEIQVLKVVKGDQPVAIFFNHGLHPLQASDKLVETGHPGYAMDLVESQIPGVQAMYAASGAGNQFPLPGRGEAYRGLGGEKRCRALGEELGRCVLDIASGDLVDVTGPILTRMEVFSLPLAPPLSKEEAKEKAKRSPKDVDFVPYPEKYRSTNWVRMLLHHYDKKIPFPTKTTEMICTDDTYLIHESDTKMLKRYEYSIHDEFPCKYEEVIVARIGPMPFVAMQGEICGPLVMRIKDAFRRNGPILVNGYMGEHNLYIPTRELVRVQAYQGKVIQTQYACPVPWAPEVEDEMVKGVIRMVSGILR